MAQTQNLIRGFIALIVLIAFGALIVTNPIVTSVAGGVLWSRDYNSSMKAAYYERNFQRVCPEYKAASTWDRWFDQNLSYIGWCDGYIDRL
ncbi:hypothetical protein [Rhizobium sp. BK176]|uniref:hypothetical protein n=1 Tax=Rhizobium sp. BK176 TaxID=2587071 RepID=UPI00216837D2|nr:hypothetical protein [Rhizobium sp. BK176]MCS4089540.1 hypothetical protein [Rhizobium sp. BK176]